jgi:HD-like signal output (HDOD) protein
LHDIGESRVYRIFSEMGVSARDPSVPDLVARYHPRAGAELALKWKLPAEIVEVCGKHHDPAASGGEALRIVRIADFAMPHLSARLAGAEVVDLSASLAEHPELDLPHAAAQAIVEGSLVAAQRL